MAFDFNGKKVLVTGAGRGIGRGIALGLAGAGCKVYALDCAPESLEKLAAESSNIVPVQQDLANWDETRTTLEKLQALDGLVNNAGIHLEIVPGLDVTKTDLDRHISINLLAGINCIPAIAKKMIEDGKKASIVNISSIASLAAGPGSIGYCVTKAGVDMVTKQFALELGHHNIRVNSVKPTAVETELTRQLYKQRNVFEFVVERTPLGRIAQIEEVVGPVMYLLSDYASMVTGTQHVIDGGINCNITTES